MSFWSYTLGFFESFKRTIFFCFPFFLLLLLLICGWCEYSAPCWIVASTKCTSSYCLLVDGVTPPYVSIKIKKKYIHFNYLFIYLHIDIYFGWLKSKYKYYFHSWMRADNCVLVKVNQSKHVCRTLTPESPECLESYVFQSTHHSEL